jgi:hypothetical protein
MSLHALQRRILAMTPSCRKPEWCMVKSTMALMDHVRREGDHMEWMSWENCSLLPQARHKMLRAAMDSGFTHGLLIDDDMMFPADILDGMLAHMETGNVKAIGINYVRKSSPKPYFTAVGLDGKLMYSNASAGLERCMDCGLGFFLLDLSAMTSMPEPWFCVEWDNEIKDYVGEDRYFTRKLQREIWATLVYIDHDASRRVKHIGYHAFGSEWM